MNEIENVGRTPWSFDAWGDIRDAENFCVARANGNLSGKDARRVTETIVEAVNEREKMRCLVCRMGGEIAKSVSAAKQFPDSPSCHRIVHVGTQLLAEARALLKETGDGQK